jgi:hypothetical protein
MLTIERVIAFLRQFPPAATIRGYEGEIIGIVIEQPGDSLGGAPDVELGYMHNDGRLVDAREPSADAAAVPHDDAWHEAERARVLDERGESRGEQGREG